MGKKNYNRHQSYKRFKKNMKKALLLYVILCCLPVSGQINEMANSPLDNDNCGSINDYIQGKISNALKVSDDFFNRGVDLYNKGKYTEAQEFFYLSDSIMYIAKGEESNYFGYGELWIASCYYKMGEDNNAQEFSRYYRLPPVDRRLTHDSDSLLDLADRLYKEGHITDALIKYHAASEIEKNNLGSNSYWYANTLSRCAEICIEIKDYQKAVDYEKRAIEIREKSLGKDLIDYYYSLKNLYGANFQKGDLDETIKYGENLIEYLEKHEKEANFEFQFFPIYSSTIMLLYSRKMDMPKTIEYGKKAIEVVERLDYDNDDYLAIYHHVIMGYAMIKQDSLYLDLCKKILEKYDNNISFNNSSDLFDIINVIANYYFNTEDFTLSSMYLEKALALPNIKKDNVYASYLSHLVVSYIETGKMEDALHLAKESVNLVNTDSLNHDNITFYAELLKNLAHCYFVTGDYKNALRYGKQVYELLNDNYGITYKATLSAVNNLSQYYSKLGYYDETYRLLNIVIEQSRKDPIKNGEALSSALNDMSIYICDDNPQTALKYADEAYRIRKDLFGENHLPTVQSLFNKGIPLIEIGNVSEAINCITKALTITESIIGGKSYRYTRMLEIMPLIYGRGGDLQKAIHFEKEIVANYHEITGDHHPLYLHSLVDLSELSFFSKDSLLLNKMLIEISKGYKQLVISDFPNYTANERASVLNGMTHFFDWLFPLICYYQNSSKLNGELYNAQLLRKGVLLNSDIEFSSLVRESGDSSLINQYNDLIKNKNKLNRMYQIPLESRTIDLDSIKRIIAAEEDQLVISSKAYGDYTKSFRVSWEDVRKMLKTNEIAIEFISFNDTCIEQKKQYYALILRYNSPSPKMIPLCTESQIISFLNNNRSDDSLYKLIWDPILKQEKDINSIFFSPIGILNSIGIEYEIENDTSILDVYRLSSTRELLYRKDKKNCNTAVLYGGLSYDIDVDQLIAQSHSYTNLVESSSILYRGLSDSLSVRGNFEPLFNTIEEVNEIGSAISTKGLTVIKYTGEIGTEESFKCLSGMNYNIIHLATHGMYIGVNEAETKKKNNNFNFIQLGDNSLRGADVIVEDNALTRSFVVMTGGDLLPQGEPIPDNIEDGILTALEISKLDLRNLDLVTLSACQTALGDVDNEGVYGLQRGFKKAGANTILMSLDKVDDEATKILMVEFYRNLMDGKTKHQSLKDAQKYLRSVENGRYDDPKYWASFIMLDGLN